MTATTSTTTSLKDQRQLKRVHTRITPWNDMDELEAVGKSLLLVLEMPSNHTNKDPCFAEIREALRRVDMYRMRVDHGQLPHSLETTASLVSIILRDKEANHNYHNNNTTTMELRLGLASAITRGTNGLADAILQKQKQGLHQAQKSVASLCARVGLPAWVVDLRHDASHNALPSLPSLRLAAHTLLSLLGQIFWNHAKEARLHDRTHAASLLTLYKKASKEHATFFSFSSTPAKDDAPTTSTISPPSEIDPSDNTIPIEQQNKDTDMAIDPCTSDDDDDDDVEDDMEDGFWDGGILGTSVNRFAALGPTDKSKSTKVNAETEAPSEATKTTTSVIAPKKERQFLTPRPKQCAMQYLKTVPIDVGHRVALLYLVWGGVGDAPVGRGALIPGSITAFPSTPIGLERIQSRYQPLMFALCDAWTGFCPALLNHLVSFLLSIDQEAHDEYLNNPTRCNNINPSVSTTEKDTNNESFDATEQLDAGTERKLYFLKFWIRLLLSRKFHLRWNKALGIMPTTTTTTVTNIDADDNDKHGGGEGQSTTESVDLSRKKKSKWTEAERAFMLRPAPLAVLRIIQFPLNALCDRCEEQLMLQNMNVPPTSTTTAGRGLGFLSATREVKELLQQILLHERVQGHGLGLNLHQRRPLKRQRMCTANDNNEEDEASKMLQTTEDHVSINSRQGKATTSYSYSMARSNNEPMSLADLEAMLSDSDEEDSIMNPNTVPASSMDETKDAQKFCEQVPSCTVSPWTLCDSWEPCAIGNLPGHP
eukprot:scaffold17185_cov56-Attheya_sp.AAC.10